jgi:exosortase E/protease (VPEID-CTERM system)
VALSERRKEGTGIEAALGQSSAYPTGRKLNRLLRWASLALLFAAGLVVLSGSGPTQRLYWFRIVLYDKSLAIPFLSRFQFAAVFISSAAAAIAFGWTTYRDEFRRALAERRADDATRLVWFLILLVAVAELIEFANSHTRSNATESLGIAALSLAALISWCLAAMPGRFWWSCIAKNPLALIAATAVGLSIYAISFHFSWFGLLDPFEHATLWASSAFLHLIAKDVVFDPKENLLGANGFAVYVGIQCAGLEGIALFSAFFGAYLWIFRGELRFPQTLALIPVGIVLLFFLNIVRLVALILLGGWSGSLGIRGFHSVAGWLLFNAVTLGLVVASRRFSSFSRSTASRSPVKIPNPAAPYLVPMLTIIIAAMITRIFFFTFDVLYPLRAATTAGALWLYRKNMPLQWTISWPAVVLGCLAFGAWILFISGVNAPARDLTITAGLGGLSAMSVGVWIILRIAGAVVLVPIAEELAFRGYLLRKLVSADFEKVAFGHFTWLSFLGSSILFGVLHAQWKAGILAGMMFAIASYRRGLISDAVVAHATANGLLAAYVLTTGHWSLWD